MSGRRARRERTIAELLANVALTEQAATELRAATGADIAVTYVNTDPDAGGYTLTCGLCGTTATVPFDPGDKVGVCPDCLRTRRPCPHHYTSTPREDQESTRGTTPHHL